MRVSSCYDRETCPAIVDIMSPSRCHFCGMNSKPMKKGTKAVLMIYNCGPVGRSYICLKHARVLRDELAALDI